MNDILRVQELIGCVHLNPIWLWNGIYFIDWAKSRWTTEGKYTVNSTYTFLYNSGVPMVNSVMIWRSFASIRSN